MCQSNRPVTRSESYYLCTIMRIGFDAKRVFHNGSGLGEYGRNLIQGLSKDFPEVEAHLYSPKPGKHFSAQGPYAVLYPQSFSGKAFKSLWRSRGIVEDLKKDRIELYHGLSNELPIGLSNAGIPSVVTLHDLIFLSHPQFYSPIDVKIYQNKFAYALQNATKVIAISEQTRKEILQWQKIPEENIEVVYQGCRPEFYKRVGADEIQLLKEAHGLEAGYILTVGAGNPRKNLEVLIDALAHFVPASRPTLVIAAGESAYMRKVRQYALAREMQSSVKFLSGISDLQMVTLYQGASVFVFPSVAEGFGVPLLEAMAAGVPIVASDIPGFREVCGEAATFVPERDSKGFAAAIQALQTRSAVSRELVEAGTQRARQFLDADPVGKTVEIYRQIMGL